ncbi:MAG: PAS domain S-box protein, partial [Proteobacteria bacterium]|nr:PAS domain S-box protein [Pseudomonadota bacterium]
WNERLREITGMFGKEGMGTGWAGGVHPEDRERVFNEWYKSEEARATFKSEYRFIDRSGKVTHTIGQAVPMLDIDENMTGYVGTITDITERKRAEDALRESEESLATAQQIAHIGSWDWRIQDNRLILSDEIYRQAGLKPKEITLTYEDFEDFVHPDDRERINSAVEQALGGKKPYSVEARMIRVDGTEWIMHAQGTIYRNKEGKAVRFIGTQHDITERKRTTHELRESEEKYRSIFETMVNGFAVLELIYDDNGKALDCRYVELNPAHEKLTGLETEKIIGKTLKECIPNYEHRLVEIYESVDETGEPVHFDTYVEGLTRWFSASVYRTRPGFVTVIFENITERKQAEDQLREAESRFRTVADFTHDWEYWLDPVGNYVYVSPSCERVTGYRSDELFRDPDLLKNIIHPDDWSAFADHKHETTETGETLAIDFRIVTRSGRERWIGHVCQPVHGDDGRYLGQRGSNRDITERKRAEKALQSEKLLSDEYINSLPGLFYVFDEERFIRWNKKWEKVTGYSEEELATK